MQIIIDQSEEKEKDIQKESQSSYSYSPSTKAKNISSIFPLSPSLSFPSLSSPSYSLSHLIPFSTYNKIIKWSGYEWEVKKAITQPTGPGPNFFSDDFENVWIDENNYLHLKIRKASNGKWYSSEVINRDILGYGQYKVEILSDISNLDIDVILGMFTWDDKNDYFHREIDIEIAKWGDLQCQTNAQFVVQPASLKANLQRFKVDMKSGEKSSYLFEWNKENVKFLAEIEGEQIASWVYSGSKNPPAENGEEHFRINTWVRNPKRIQDGSKGPFDGKEVQIIFKEFSFKKANES